MTPEENKKIIQDAIHAFAEGDLTRNTLELFKKLGYNTDRQAPMDVPDFATFREFFIGEKPFHEERAKVSDWKHVDLLFQLTKEEVQQQISMFDTGKVDQTIIEAYLFFAIELTEESYTRTELSQITREVNRLFPMPVMLLFKYGSLLTLSVINRRIDKRDEHKDVLEKVTQIKDISIQAPHRAHIEILFDLSFDELKRRHKVTNFVELHNAWQKTLDTKELNKIFYQKLFNWYLWALKEVKFPQMRPERDMIDDKVHQSESLIRLLTRLLFVWFMKEKGLISAHLFNPEELKTILKGFAGKESDQTIFYKAILQNLFFATLNQPIEKRKAIEKKEKYNPDYGNPLVYRFDGLFNSPENIHHYFADIPFLNGGLFECLDQRKDSENTTEIRLDGFSTIESKQVHFPDKYFFGEYSGIDLSSDYDDTKKKNLTVFGIIDILDSYKFTIEESTPIEKEIALDPELLGKVFENLLASYNPETQTTARKQTGSFYTPPEIVNYMVDESLIQHLKSVVDDEERLRELFSYKDLTLKNPFNDSETKALIQSIDNCKILDPACGSGAFPMGALQKMTHVLHKLDPENKLWFEMVIGNLPTYMQAEARRKLEKENWNYVRKLGIIQQCLYGVDIQPIAVQISKLRFFISLLVDQEGKPGEPNMGYEPLPNLDFKLVAANTLIPAPENEAMEAYASDAVANFEKLSNEYFSAVSERKMAIKNELKSTIARIVQANQQVVNQWIDKIRKEYNSATPAKRKKNDQELEKFQKALDLWNTFPNLYKNESVGFYETRFFFPQVNEGFDVVIGNPPYVSISKMEAGEKKQLQTVGYRTFENSGDIYMLFYERGFNLLKQDGNLMFITSRQWIQASYGRSLRNFLVGETCLKQIIDFGQVKIFEGATVFVNILSCKKSSHQSGLGFCLMPDDYIIEKEDLNEQVKKARMQLRDLSGETWVLSESDSIYKKIEAIGKPIRDWQEIDFYRGVTTGFNTAFHITEEVKNRLLRDPKNQELIEPLLRGKDIKRYVFQYDSLFLINTLPSKRIDFTQYPLIEAYLDQFRFDLEPKPKNHIGKWGGRKPGGYKWYEIQDDTAYWPKFSQPKIIWIEISDRANFAYDEHRMYLTNSAYFLTCKSELVSLKYLLALLNSRVSDFYFSNKTARIAGGRMRYTKQYVEQVPIPAISIKHQEPFIRFANEILSIKQTNPYADTTALENRIDELVFKLYDLTYEEVKVIVPDFWLSEEEYEELDSSNLI
jgi:adenine-specific DNA-methyltransferase